MPKKIKFDWKHTLFFFLLMGGIYIITNSFFMSLGILLMLFVIDHYLQILDEKLKEKAEKKAEEDDYEEINDNIESTEK